MHRTCTTICEPKKTQYGCMLMRLFIWNHHTLHCSHTSSNIISYLKKKIHWYMIVNHVQCIALLDSIKTLQCTLYSCDVICNNDNICMYSCEYARYSVNELSFVPLCCLGRHIRKPPSTVALLQCQCVCLFFLG